MNTSGKLVDRKVKDTIIVGHGPSLFDADLAEFIDKHKNVVRIMRFFWQDIKNYGSKVDYVSMTEGQLKFIPEFKHTSHVWAKTHRNQEIKPKELWVNYGFPRMYGPAIGRKSDWLKNRYSEYKINVFSYLSFYWRYVYEKIDPKPRQFSSGILAVMTACSYLRPKDLCLAGFDNIEKGDAVGYRSGEHTFISVDDFLHNLKSEHALIEKMRKVYGVNIWYL